MHGENKIIHHRHKQTYTHKSQTINPTVLVLNTRYKHSPEINSATSFKRYNIIVNKVPSYSSGMLTVTVHGEHKMMINIGK